MESVRTFAAWLKASEMSAQSLAEALGVSRAVVYKWLAGECMPSASTLIKLEAMSGGRITARSFARQAATGGADASED